MKFSIKIIGTESNTTHQRTFCNSLRRRSHKQDTELDIIIQVLETQLIGFVDKSRILSHILSVLIQLLALNYRLSISSLNKITQRDASQVPTSEQVFAYVDDLTIAFTQSPDSILFLCRHLSKAPRDQRFRGLSMAVWYSSQLLIHRRQTPRILCNSDRHEYSEYETEIRNYEILERVRCVLVHVKWQ